ncbi:MAG: glycosyltransferase family 1 protein [Microthrixaceae bacterium]
MSKPDPDRKSTPKVFVEVTDTLAISYTTGIQRVVRELIIGLRGPDGAGLQIIPVVKPSARSDYRALTDDEDEALQGHPPGGRAGRRADNFGRLSPIVRRVGDARPVIATRVLAGKVRKKRREYHPQNAALAIGPMGPGSIFLDIEGSWFDPEPRTELLPRLRSQGVNPVVLVHDVMPVIHPEWFDPRQVGVFEDWLMAHLRHSTGFLANSECTANDLRTVARNRGIRSEMDITVIPLGADFSDESPVPVDLPNEIGRYVIVVGTIEPRKNQKLVLDTFDALRHEYPDLGLVLVGKEGWMVDELVARIRGHEEFGHRLQWLGGIDDGELTWLYQNAFLSVAPSLYEGLGVPVIEALGHGCPTLSSTGGALPEAGTGFSELFDPDDGESLTAMVAKHLDDDAYHSDRVELASRYIPPTWVDTTRTVAGAIRAVTDAPRSHDRLSAD